MSTWDGESPAYSEMICETRRMGCPGLSVQSRGLGSGFVPPREEFRAFLQKMTRLFGPNACVFHF